jgi:hypothetical protein
MACPPFSTPGALCFTPDRPVPEDVLVDLILARKKEIAAKR